MNKNEVIFRTEPTILYVTFKTFLIKKEPEKCCHTGCGYDKPCNYRVYYNHSYSYQCNGSSSCYHKRRKSNHKNWIDCKLKWKWPTDSELSDPENEVGALVRLNVFGLKQDKISSHYVVLDMDSRNVEPLEYMPSGDRISVRVTHDFNKLTNMDKLFDAISI